MGKIRFSFALMLLVAVSVLLAGERLARREIELREEADRDALEKYALDLRSELNDLNDNLKDHLWNLAEKCKEREDVSDLIDRSSYLRAAYLVERSRKTEEWIPLPRVNQRSAPEVVSEGSRAPLNQETAIKITQQMIDDSFFGQSGWEPSADLQFRLYWVCPEKGMIVAFVADFDAMSIGIEKKIREWGTERFSSFHGDRKMAVLESDEGSQVLGAWGEGSSKVSIPLQTPMGTFWVRAWDHLETRREYDGPTLTVAGLMALSLAVVAWMIMRSQVRAWKDAEERVSFANRVSHELGTPLTNMTLNLDLAARSLRSDPEKAGQRLEKVREEVARLARLVGNVLTRTRKEQGLLQGSPSVNVPDELIADVLSQFQPALERREIKADFKKGAAIRILVDPDAFSQIVWNLISNVEKHAASGGWLGIESAIHEDELTISVSDWGPGISEENRERIFTAFERVHAKVTEGTSGTGLGLSISLDLARMMGGSLELLPGDEGAHFQLTIPAVKS